MGLPEIYGAPYIATIDGATVSFSQFKMAQIAKLAALLESQNRERAARHAKAQKMNEQQAAAFMLAAESESVDFVNIDRFAETIEGMQQICVRACVLGGKSEDEAKALVGNMDEGTARDAARYVVGSILSREIWDDELARTKKAEGEHGANPPPSDAPSTGAATTG